MTMSLVAMWDFKCNHTTGLIQDIPYVVSFIVVLPIGRSQIVC